EAIVHSRLEHPNILPFLGIYHEDTNFPLIILPFVEHGSLEGLLDRMEPSELMEQPKLVRILIGSARGLVYLHTRDPPILHGDLHPGNILIDEFNNPILCDFGVGKIRHEKSLSLMNHGEGGRTRFVAPELWETNRSTQKSDVFALAMVYLNAWTARPPFAEIQQRWRVAKSLTEGMRPKEPVRAVALGPGARASFWNLLALMWAQEPASRPQGGEVL
ncbi:kinase-like protein, partial [Clavulina sp. PMI_390]